MMSAAPIIAIDPALCTGCRRCAAVCPVGAVGGPDRQAQTIDAARCVLCGQCVQICSAFASPFDDEPRDLPALRRARGLPEDDPSPLFAAHFQSARATVAALLADPAITTMVQCAPAVRAAVAEEFGLPPGSLTPGRLAAALRRLGFDAVYDTTFAADVTIMEESAELLARLESGRALPLFTSCCPGWVRHLETAWPDLLGCLSSCKSPQQMAGALMKTYGAMLSGLSPETVACVTVMPCTAKKFEAARPEMRASGSRDVDAVLTVTELAALLKARGIDLPALPDEPFDQPLGLYTGAGAIFGATGGVMEAALRTAVAVTTGRDVAESGVDFVPDGSGGESGSESGGGVRRATVTVAGRTVRAVVVSGLARAAGLLEAVRAGRADFDFLEVMCCPGGCVAGGGQPKLVPGIDVSSVIARRRAALHTHDRELTLRASHRNPAVVALYETFLEKPLGRRAHELLHTRYGAAAREHE